MGAVHEALAKHGSDVAAMGLLWLLPVLAFLVALIRP